MVMAHEMGRAAQAKQQTAAPPTESYNKFFASINRMIGNVAYGALEQQYTKDVGRRMKNIAAKGGTASMMLALAEHQAYKKRMEARKQYLEDVMAEASPEMAMKRAKRFRTGFGETAARALARAQAGGEGAVLDVSRAIRRGTSAEFQKRMGMAATKAQEEIGQRTAAYQEEQQRMDEADRIRELAGMAYSQQLDAQARASAAEARKTHAWKQALVGWTVPF